MKNTENKSFIRLRFDLKSFIIACILFIIEVLIALFLNDPIIRPYIGDTIVVILIYYFLKAFFEIKPIYLIIGVVLFSFCIEIGQYFNLVKILGFEDNQIMRVVIGTGFSWIDIAAYTLGGIMCYFIEKKNTKKILN